MIVAAGTSFSGLFSFLTTAANWQGTGGLLHRLLQHLGYSAETLALSVLIALPLGLLTGHTGRGGNLVSLLSNASRALPTLGLLILFAILIGVGINAAIIPLVFLAISSILVNTHVGISSVDRTVVDAARGMGLTGWQALWRVEFPVALPLVILGVRTAALQVVSTATIAADVGLGGLGRLIIDGQATHDYAALGAGALVVAVFAIVVEGLFLLGQYLVVSPGIRRGRNLA